MRLAHTLHWSNTRRAPLWRRTATLALVIALHGLLLLMLLRLAPPKPLPTQDKHGPITVQLLPEASPAPKSARSKAERAKGAASRRAQHRAAAPAATAKASSAIWSQVIPLSKEEFAAADIGRMPSRPAALAADGESGAGGDSGSAGEDGGGPNGERLYNADWYHKPTNAELAAYLPAGAPLTGWGMIACRTVENYRVEDCLEIGQSPVGSELARAVRQAAWQFRVLPPRVGGRAIIGAWVRIRIDYSEIR